MCLILFSFQPQTAMPLILAANRDEFFKRDSERARFWDDTPEILAGRDLIAHGTWLGVTTTGRLAAVTNVREPVQPSQRLRSRGDLTREFLSSHQEPSAYLEALLPDIDEYAGFNLLVGEFTQERQVLYYISNRSAGIQTLTAGMYGLSNHLLDSDWPKIVDGKQWLQQALFKAEPDLHQTLRQQLENPNRAADERLPDTGVGYESEKALSSTFITLGDYGTRASTVLTIENGLVRFSEQNYSPSYDGKANTLGEVSSFEFFLPTRAAARQV